MTNSQREALERHIPTTEVIRDAVTFPRHRLGEPLEISAERFDKWLIGVRKEAFAAGQESVYEDQSEDYDMWAREQ